jgi:myo-inositol-1-phosphate synthase
MATVTLGASPPSAAATLGAPPPPPSAAATLGAPPPPRAAAANIRIAIVGLGNCASALVQGLSFYGDAGAPAGAPPACPSSPGFAPPALAAAARAGLVRERIGGYGVGDVECVVAFDVDARKVGKTVAEAIFAAPNCCFRFATPACDAPVLLAPALDGVAAHMRAEKDASRTFLVHPDADARAPSAQELVAELVSRRVDILINYLPVGSQDATALWAQVCIDARVPLVNCIPVFIASDPAWEARFVAASLPLIGDDMKSQFGASILSQMLQELAYDRGHAVVCHIQQNSGGNTDVREGGGGLARRAGARLGRAGLTLPFPPLAQFFNMTDRERLASKKTSKENVLRSVGDIAGIPRADAGFLFAGPSDYVPFFGDNKIASLHIEMEGFGGAPVTLDARLSVQDSPNSAGVVIDAIRFLQVARELGIVGALRGPSAFTQKSPPAPMRLADAIAECDALAERHLTATTRAQLARSPPPAGDTTAEAQS